MGRKPLFWMSSSRRDLKDFPDQVQDLMGAALLDAQHGDKHPDAKPLSGFGGASVLEVVADDKSGTYRGVYTVRFSEAVYVLHAFQKKSKSGIATTKLDMDLIRMRLKMAEQHYTSKGGKL